MREIRLQLHDTLSGKLKRFEPQRPGEARIYTCGPTTYDVAHAGHARAAVAPDVLVRHLRAQGIKVTYVRNITDVDDKILKRAQERGEEPTDLSAHFAKLYQADIRAAGCVDPDVEPRVSASIGDIVALIEKLIEKGAAYELQMPNGAKDVYYSVRAFPDYGKLGKRNIDELKSGARIEASDDKRDPLDFALWKGSPGEAWGFESPWGKGRPGWHIECSAMADRFLGHGFDVHCGGMDLIFPHHENEIAQSEAARPGEGPFAHTWIHNGFINVDKEKMSKSLGNFVTLADVYERYDGEALRWFLLTVHYRLPVSFDIENHCLACDAVRADREKPCEKCGAEGKGRVVFPGLLEAERRVDYLYQALGRLEALSAQSPEDYGVPKSLAAIDKLASEARARVDAGLDDDLNTPVGLTVLGELGKAANELCDMVVKRKKDQELVRAAPAIARKLEAAIRSSAEPLGLLLAPAEVYRARTQKQRLALLGTTAEAIDGKLKERTQARQDKDFAKADVIRKALDAQGIEVNDGAEATTWRVLPGGAPAPRS